MITADCASIVELTIACRNLPNLDILSKSDPICVVYLQVSSRWKEIGRTEIIWDNLNPEFSKKITLAYQFEERQLLRFEVYDIDSENGPLEDQDFIGSIEVSLGEIVSMASLSAFERPLENRRRAKTGTIRIFAEEASSCKEDFLVRLYAGQLPTGFFRKRRYFLEIHKTTENSGLHLVYRSEKVATSKKGTVDWPQFQLNKYTLCNGDIDRPIVITLYKFKENGSHRSRGAWNTSVRNLLDNSADLPFTYKLSPSGAIFTLTNFSKGAHESFLDYITIGGVQMHCFLAIDFTASNGDPMNPSSLHYIHSNGQNQYQTALRSVTEIIQDYDSDKLFPVLGFGAKLPPHWFVNHEFFVNFHPTNPYCEGVEGVMAAYANALRQVKLHGPTNFAPIINHVSRFAASNTDGRSYFILLIITDGIISDMQHTINAIVAASSLPMSIIIVGVGNADFSAMEVLDADVKPLVDTNLRTMKRDIVQFVPFSEVMQKSGNNWTMAKVNLAKEVLFELPTQFLSYMKTIGMTSDNVAALRKKDGRSDDKPQS